jgi:glutaminase
VSELDVVVAQIVDEMRRRPDRGEVATYIPELAAVDSKQFGLEVIIADGHVAAEGDSDTPFSIQSNSKVLTLTLALGKVGDRLWRRVGREPSGIPGRVGDCKPEILSVDFASGWVPKTVPLPGAARYSGRRFEL